MPKYGYQQNHVANTANICGSKVVKYSWGGKSKSTKYKNYVAIYEKLMFNIKLAKRKSYYILSHHSEILSGKSTMSKWAARDSI